MRNGFMYGRNSGYLTLILPARDADAREAITPSARSVSAPLQSMGVGGGSGSGGGGGAIITFRSRLALRKASDSLSLPFRSVSSWPGPWLHIPSGA